MREQRREIVFFFRARLKRDEEENKNVESNDGVGTASSSAKQPRWRADGALHGVSDEKDVAAQHGKELKSDGQTTRRRRANVREENGGRATRVHRRSHRSRRARVSASVETKRFPYSEMKIKGAQKRREESGIRRGDVHDRRIDRKFIR